MSNKKCPARPVETLVKVITKRWNLQILYDMFKGKRHFNEFKEDKPDLLNKTLSRCLQELESNNLIEKRINPNDGKDTEYILSENGRLLNRIIYDLMVYSMDIDRENEYFTEEYKEIMKKQAKITLNIDN